MSDVEYQIARRTSPQVSRGTPRTVTATGSPYAFTAPSAGVMYLSAGTVTDVTLARAGVSLALGVLAGTYPLATGDILTITYAVAPTLRWFP